MKSPSVQHSPPVGVEEGGRIYCTPSNHYSSECTTQTNSALWDNTFAVYKDQNARNRARAQMQMAFKEECGIKLDSKLIVIGHFDLLNFRQFMSCFCVQLNFRLIVPNHVCTTCNQTSGSRHCHQAQSYDSASSWGCTCTHPIQEPEQHTSKLCGQSMFVFLPPWNGHSPPPHLPCSTHRRSRRIHR